MAEWVHYEYNRPKPFVRVLGKEMILWVLDNLSIRECDTLVIVFNPAFLSMDVFMREIIQPKFTDCKLVELAGPTRGAAETVLLGLRGLNDIERSRPTMLVDGDCFYTVDIAGMFREVCTTHNATFCFNDTQPKPLYSYVTLKAGTNDVLDIKEKIKISDNANTGCYCFKSGTELAAYCEKIIEAGTMQLSQDQKGEYYTSGVIKAMLDDQIPCKMLEVDRSQFHVLGTPAQVKEFCKRWPKQKCTRFVFDLDHTLCTGPTITGDYATCLPIARNISYLKQLHEQGHYIIIATARRMRTHCGKVGAVVADIGATTISWLEQYGIPYHELCFGKPWGQFYIDDLAIDPIQGGLAEQIGFYPTEVSAGDPTWPGTSPFATTNSVPPSKKAINPEVYAAPSTNGSMPSFALGVVFGVVLCIALTTLRR